MKVSDIEVVENMIRLLNECLAISIKNKQKIEVVKIRKDIEACKKELYRLKNPTENEAAKN